MAIERQNNISSKLAGLNHIPEGFAFDKNGLWQKIKETRTSKSKRRSLLYAAILIPAIVTISWVFIGQQKGDKVIVTLPAKPVKPSEQLITLPKENDVVQKNLPGQSIAKASPAKIERLGDIKLQTTKKIVFTESSVINIPSEEAIAAAPRSDSVAVAATPKPKYKYRIAHINEIDDVQVQPSTLIAQKIIKKPFFASVTTVPATDGDKIVQKKKSPFSFLGNPIQ
jgi:hypothetical protein